MNTGIIGLGLIGGSILKRLSEKGCSLYAVTRNPETIKAAKKYALKVSNDISILKDCSCVFVCTPIDKTLETLDRLETIVNKNCLVMDCASVKEFAAKKRPYKFIPSHPMAGTEKSGFSASFPELFEGAVWVLTPFDDTPEEDIKQAEKIIQLTGARTVKMSASEHDRAAALISHFPMLAAQALFYCIKDNPAAKILASSGFRDMTRLAASNLEMGCSMRKYNAENIKSAENEFFKAVEFLMNTENNEIFSEIKNERLKMYSPEGKNTAGSKER